MSKGLEALEKLYPKTTYMPYYTRSEKRAFCKIVEKELKALEILKKEPYIAVNWYLEGTYEEYKNVIEKVKITEEEWNFVREVLL